MSTSTWDFRTAARNLDIDLVPFWGDPEEERGISTGRKLGIAPSEPHPVFVGAHEMAHIVLGHTTAERFMRMLDFENVNRRQEIEAHTVAILVAYELGLTPGTDWEPNAEHGYLFCHGGHDEQAIMGHLNRNRRKITSAVAAIVAAGQRLEGE